VIERRGARPLEWPACDGLVGAFLAILGIPSVIALGLLRLRGLPPGGPLVASRAGDGGTADGERHECHGGYEHALDLVGHRCSFRLIDRHGRP